MAPSVIQLSGAMGVAIDHQENGLISPDVNEPIAYRKNRDGNSGRKVLRTTGEFY
jgi:hypothetical protein